MTGRLAENKYGKYSVPESTFHTYTAQAILDGKVHEPSTIQYILDNCNGEVIHAGVGFGDFLPALRRLPRVWAFEPVPQNFDAAMDTIELNNIENVNLFNCALNHSNTPVKLKIDGIRSEVSEDGLIVDSVKLDCVIPETANISVIHLDIEGYENEVLIGAKRLIQRCKPIIILEIDDRATRYNSFMEEFGYEPHTHLIYDCGPMVFVNTVYIPKQIP